jgi:hypothetical protein
MNSRRGQIYLLAGLFALCGCAAGEQHEDTITRKWPASGIVRVDVHEVSGSVDIAADSPAEVLLTAHVHTRGFEADAKKENKGYFNSDLEGDTLSIGRRKHGASFSIPFLFSRDDITVDYELHIPRNLALELRTVNGRITTRGGDGETRAITVNGSIDVETSGAAEVTAKSVNGPLRARFLQTFQGADLKTVNGSVDAVLPANASFECDASQVNGDFEASFPLSIHSHPGSRRASGEVNGGRYELRIVTVNGDIHLAGPRPAVVAPAAPLTPPAPPRPAPPPIPASPST